VNKGGGAPLATSRERKTETLMTTRTEIPKYDCEAFARETEDPAPRETEIPRFDVGSFAREAEVVAEHPFDLADIPMWASTSPELSGIDHRIAFLMLNIDGLSSFETVIRLSHVPEAEARAALAEMLATGLIVVGLPMQDQQGEESPMVESGVWSRDPDDAGEHWTFVVQSAKGETGR
jgi:hypothetical protein